MASLHSIKNVKGREIANLVNFDEPLPPTPGLEGHQNRIQPTSTSNLPTLQISSSGLNVKVNPPSSSFLVWDATAQLRKSAFSSQYQPSTSIDHHGHNFRPRTVKIGEKTDQQALNTSLKPRALAPPPSTEAPQPKSRARPCYKRSC